MIAVGGDRAVARRVRRQAGPVARGEAAELDRLVSMYEQELDHYRHATTRTTDMAAWTEVANVLLNLDEAVTKEMTQSKTIVDPGAAANDAAAISSRPPRSASAVWRSHRWRAARR
jgi:hypothetical protein